ncbi:hypothetical protein ACFSX5_03790 [Devosia albogilva]|uniref:Uncharacterized protein n=1 Tax=Devosia albogilva TaxID=429726 RepID=A0ABW5QHS6_9HYPH
MAFTNTTTRISISSCWHQCHHFCDDPHRAASTCWRRICAPPPDRQRGEQQIPTDTTTLIALGIGAVIVLWLVFSVLRKLFGLVLLAAIAAAAWFVWQNPEYLPMLQSFFGSR